MEHGPVKLSVILLKAPPQALRVPIENVVALSV